MRLLFTFPSKNIPKLFEVLTIDVCESPKPYGIFGQFLICTNLENVGFEIWHTHCCTLPSHCPCNHLEANYLAYKTFYDLHLLLVEINARKRFYSFVINQMLGCI